MYIKLPCSFSGLPQWFRVESQFDYGYLQVEFVWLLFSPFTQEFSSLINNQHTNESSVLFAVNIECIFSVSKPHRKAHTGIECRLIFALC